MNPVQYVSGGLIVALLVFGGWQCSAKQAAQRDAAVAREALAINARNAAEAWAAFEADARQRERNHQLDLKEIESAYQERMRHVQTGADRLVADLRAGTVQLREQWRGCVAASAVPGADGAEPGTDGGADLQAAGVGRIAGIVGTCDAHVSGLQDVIRANLRATR